MNERINKHINEQINHYVSLQIHNLSQRHNALGMSRDFTKNVLNVIYKETHITHTYMHIHNIFNCIF